tara:strand:+ start:262 stop:453 length:192 start_codon:yes stop_codon:yes gene_type:complete
VGAGFGPDIDHRRGITRSRFKQRAKSLGLGHFVGQKIPGISDNILMNFLQIGPHIQYVLLFDF